MASIVLAGIGASMGAGFTSMTAGALLGKLGGHMLGSVIDQSLFGHNADNATEGRRLNEISVQTAGYGNIIPIVYGNVKIAGNIIWASKIKEHKQTTTQTYGNKFSEVSHSHTDYHYTLSFAIALCSGPITSVDHIWADDLLLDKNNKSIRIYYGTEEQLPDSLICSIEGNDKTPAYRGLAYVVFENFNITAFGDRIPNFSFEIKKSLTNKDSVENLITAVNMIPGSGEFVYDTQIQKKSFGGYAGNNKDSQTFISIGYKENINCHNDQNKANSLVSLDELKKTLPNVKWIAPVVTWFVNSLNAAETKVKPGVEFTSGAITEPDLWHVAKYDRENACIIKTTNSRPIYGGTVSDSSIVRYVKELKKRGYNVMFYPMLFVNLFDKPWRGRISCDPKHTKEFFRGEDGYNAFILHYAKLVRDHIDAFIIGSELVKLTSVYEDQNIKNVPYRSFPCVDELKFLASEVRKVLGPKVKITYAADWSEYHHTEGGWYHMDSLWDSPDIDVVGIDAYFPLTDIQQSDYNLNNVIESWNKGEGYDFYYSDNERTKKEHLGEAYAWKNIEWWWKNEHYNPNGQKTSWRPKSKKIWFTEYGFPSVDLATNQPNVFHDPTSIESGFPRHSKGLIDISAQRLGIEATERKWQNSEMIENKFLWTWDARPYPAWPDRLDYWSDGLAWFKGHWVQGKLGAVTLSRLLIDLAVKAGLNENDINISQISDIVEGFVINNHTTVREIIENLQNIYFFDVSEINYKIHFTSRLGKTVNNIPFADIVYSYDKKIQKSNFDIAELINIQTIQEFDLPSHVDINFINRNNFYNVSNQYAKRMQSNSKFKLIFNVPLILEEVKAAKVAETILYNAWTERHHYSFALPIKYAYLKLTDLVSLNVENHEHTIRITGIEFGKNYQMRITGVSEDLSLYHNLSIGDISNLINTKDKNNLLNAEISKTEFEIIDIPLTINEEQYKRLNDSGQKNNNISNNTSRILIAASGESKSWYGCELSISNDSTDLGKFLLNKAERGVIGKIASTFAVSNVPKRLGGTFDKDSFVTVNLLSGKLYSVTEDELLSGANLALVGDEILQFQNAELIGESQYKISHFIRELCYVDNDERSSNLKTHNIGDRFVLLDQNITLYDAAVSGTISGANYPSRSIKDIGVKFSAKSLMQTGQVISNDEFIHEKTVNINYAAAKPLPVTHLRSRQNIDGSVTVFWHMMMGDFSCELKIMSNDEVLNCFLIENTNEYKISAELLSKANKIILTTFNQVFGYGDLQTLTF